MARKLIRDDWAVCLNRIITGQWTWTLIAMGIGRRNIEGTQIFDCRDEAREDAILYMEKHNLKKYEPTATSLPSGANSNP